ncbi:MAG: magnetosome protein MamC [Thiohalocapsa sp.]|nr:magnetosome protein MamC [Thiohalocapsa sp.]
MSDYGYPMYPAGQARQGGGQMSYPGGDASHWYNPGPPLGNAVELGKFGAVVGVCGAGAANLHRLQAQQITGSEAVVDTLRTGVAAGLATAAASLVAGQLRSGTLSLAATLVTGAAVMYLLQGPPESSEPGDTGEASD